MKVPFVGGLEGVGVEKVRGGVDIHLAVFLATPARFSRICLVSCIGDES